MLSFFTRRHGIIDSEVYWNVNEVAGRCYDDDKKKNININITK